MEKRGAFVVLLLAAAALWWWRKSSMANITAEISTWPTGDRVWDVCRAVAMAEGYQNGRGCAPFDLNNPGDLSPGDEHGFATAGAPEFHGGSQIIHFATAADGWSALRAKFSNIVGGQSAVYGADWSIEEIGAKYAGDAVTWAGNVAAALGIPSGASLADYVRGIL